MAFFVWAKNGPAIRPGRLIWNRTKDLHESFVRYYQLIN
ncbi:hypothetical protein VPHD181_0268 [Vibrio phage D181]